MSHSRHRRHKGHSLITLAFLLALLSVAALHGLYKAVRSLWRGRGNLPGQDGPTTGEPSPVAPRSPGEHETLARLPVEQRQRIMAAIQAIERGRRTRAARDARKNRFWDEQVYNRVGAA